MIGNMFDKVIESLKKDNPALYEEYKKKGLITPAIEDFNKEIKTISPLISQQVLRILGSMCSTYNGNDIYYFVRAIYMLLSDVGEDYVQRCWELQGKDWNRTKKNLEKLDKKAIHVKSFYDALEDKKMEKRKREQEVKKFYIRTASKIPMLLPDAFDLFVFLAYKTPVHKQTIPSEAFKIIEHQGRKPLGAEKKKPETPAPQPTEVSQESD